MEMVDGLSPIFATVDDDAVTLLRYSFLPGNIADHHPQMAQEGRIGFSETFQRRDRLAGDYQHVRRGLRIHIAESDTLIVLINDLGGYFLVGDFLKECFFHGKQFCSYAS